MNLDNQGNDLLNITGVLGKDDVEKRTATIFNTNFGDDTVNVVLNRDDGFFVLNTEEGNDKVNASLSSADLVIIGGFGNDSLIGGFGRNVIFGDRGMCTYLFLFV